MLRRTALALLAVATAGPAYAQAYPNKPVSLIVPFAAGGPTDVMARIVGERMGRELGQQFIIDNVAGAAGTIAMGKLARATPDVPTTAEAGFPGIEVAIWHGLWAPKGTPPEIIAKLNAAAIVALKDPEVRRKLEDLGQDIPTPEQMAPAAFTAFQKAEVAKWTPIIEKAGVKIE